MHFVWMYEREGYRRGKCVYFGKGNSQEHRKKIKHNYQPLVVSHSVMQCVAHDLQLQTD